MAERQWFDKRDGVAEKLGNRIAVAYQALSHLPNLLETQLLQHWHQVVEDLLRIQYAKHALQEVGYGRSVDRDAQDGSFERSVDVIPVISKESLNTETA